MNWLFARFAPRFISYMKNELMKSNTQLVNSAIDKNAKLYEPYRIGNSNIGAYTYISQNSSMQNTTIGKFCSVGPNLICAWGIHPVNSLSTSPMFYSTKKQNGISLSKSDKIDEIKPVIIGNDVFIGVNVTILNGVEIGDGAIIGAGTVVSKNIPPYAVAAGCPVQIIRYRHTPEVIEKLMKIKWWDWEAGKLEEVEKYFDDVEGFINQYS